MPLSQQEQGMAVLGALAGRWCCAGTATLPGPACGLATAPLLCAAQPCPQPTGMAATGVILHGVTWGCSDW